MAALEIEVAVRRKNQLTLPDSIAKRLDVQPGDRLIFALDEGDGDLVRVRRLRPSYAGAASGIYGTADEAAAYIRDERTAWDE